MASSTIQIYNSVSARIWVEFTESDTKLFISNGGGAATLITNSETVSFNEFRKVIFTYSEDSFSLCVNGVDSTFTGTQSTFAANTLSTIRFDFGTKFVGRLKEFSHFKKVIQPSQRIKLTTL